MLSGGPGDGHLPRTCGMGEGGAERGNQMAMEELANGQAQLKYCLNLIVHARAAPTGGYEFEDTRPVGIGEANRWD